MLSKFFWKNILIAIGLAFAIVLITFLSIRIYTLHGISFETPDFSGLTIKEVKQLTEDNNLRFQIIDSVYNQKYKKRTIIDQNPSPGFKVKKNRNIFLTINASHPEKIKMPDIIGVSLRQAKAILETRGLHITKVTYVKDIAFNNVLNYKYKGKKIETGKLIPKGEGISLVLGTGYGNKHAIIPKLEGLVLKDAESKITESGLNLDEINYDKTVKTYIDSINAKVWKQRPSYSNNRKAQLGSYIDIWVTQDNSKIPVDSANTNHSINDF